MEAKEYYRDYLADNNLSELSYKVMDMILDENPTSVFEFGCGTGKHINALRGQGVDALGLDISAKNAVYAYEENKCPAIILSDESALKYLRQADVVFTVSVLDHIEDIQPIIYKLINKSVKLAIFAETNDVPGDFYYPHDYERYCLKKLEGFEWRSPADGAVYYIWYIRF